jgi:FAD/FMN-containing dehydrogenase
MSMSQYESWGRYPKVDDQEARPVHWRSELPDLGSFSKPILPRGLGRSYGDACLNEGGVLIDTVRLDRFMAIDEANARVRCEAGVSLDAIQAQIIPRGFFLPVLPGTKFVTVAGAIANDIHGKNHHIEGTFGRNVLRFELGRSDGSVRTCSRDENPDLFRATIGGLGLTGLITWAELRIKRVPSPFIFEESIRYRHVDEFLQISAESDVDYE